MNTDYRTPTTFRSDAKTLRLLRILGERGIAAITFIWCWSAIHRPEGILYDLDEYDIEEAALWRGEHGGLLPTLLDLKFIVKDEDGVLVLNNWKETNHWAAEAETRENKSRFSNMARFYPELYEELSSQGVTGISRSDFVRLTAEYDRRGILDNSSASSKKCDAYAPTPTLSPAPIPEPVPVPSMTPIPNPFQTPEPESVSGKTPKKTRKVGAKAPASSSSSSRKQEIQESQVAHPQAESVAHAESATPAESKDSLIKPEKPFVQEEPCLQQVTASVEVPESPEPQPQQVEQEADVDAVEATVLDVLTQWNIQLARLGFPQVLRSTARREAAFKARVRASQERIYLAWWVALFDKIAASDFMCESARQKANWLTLDWVLKEQNMMKILEGKYDSERPVTAEIYNKTFRGRRFSGGKKGTTQATSAQNANVQNAQLQQDASTDGIPEESLRRINEARATLGKLPLSNDTCTAECSDPIVKPEPVTALPKEIERDIPSENLPDEDSSNVENTGCFEGYTAEELAEFDEILAETRAERTAQEAEFEASFNCEEYPAEMSDEEYESYEKELEAIRREQEEYEASMKGADDYYVNE